MSLSALNQKPPAAAAITSNMPNIHFFTTPLPEHFSSFNQRDLRDIYPAAAKPAFAIHQIIAPKRNEFFVETAGQSAFVYSSVKTRTPPFQCLRIMQPEIMLVLPFEAVFIGQRTETAFGE